MTLPIAIFPTSSPFIRDTTFLRFLPPNWRRPAKPNSRCGTAGAGGKAPDDRLVGLACAMETRRSVSTMTWCLGRPIPTSLTAAVSRLTETSAPAGRSPRCCCRATCAALIPKPIPSRRPLSFHIRKTLSSQTTSLQSYRRTAWQTLRIFSTSFPPCLRHGPREVSRASGREVDLRSDIHWKDGKTPPGDH